MSSTTLQATSVTRVIKSAGQREFIQGFGGRRIRI
jgi:hypothetical protein